jgi:hypothetical protein
MSSLSPGLALFICISGHAIETTNTEKALPLNPITCAMRMLQQLPDTPGEIGAGTPTTCAEFREHIHARISCPSLELDFLDVFRLRPLGSLFSLELHALSFR